MKFGRLKEMYDVAEWQPEVQDFSQYKQLPIAEHFGDIELDDTPMVDQSFPKVKIYWVDDSSTQTELLSTQDEKVQALIYLIRKSKIIPNHESLANRLLTLFNMAKEENPTSLGIAFESLNNFYDFIQLNTNIKNPTLSLSPDYNIYASWRAKGQLFSAHFLQNGEIRFVFFKPNKRHPKHKIRITGTVTSDTLMEITTPESLNNWVLDEKL